MLAFYIPYSYLAYALVFMLLALFGVGYNALVSYLEKKHYQEGMLSLLVALGVAVTLLGFAILDSNASALIALFCFAASGSPMMAGSLMRYLKARKKFQKVLKRHDDETQSA
jgi:predicted MFS family arabinose efflux permease